VPADAPAAEEEGEREVGDPAAGTRQAEKRVALVHRLPDASGPPVGIGFHVGDHSIGKDRTNTPPSARSADRELMEMAVY